jgi:2-dehydro-3-deoxygluconokinase
LLCRKNRKPVNEINHQQIQGSIVMTTYDLSTIGEGQIRFTVDSGERLMFTRNVRMNPACSEANVAGLTAQLGWRTLWTSSLPEGDLGDYILSEYRSVGVDMHTMVRKPGGRTALYFMEPGAGPMPANVIYDREWTPFRSTGIDEYDWDTMLDTEVVFLTGITASLTDTTAQVVRYAADEAVRRGAEVILDVNFRRKLWSGERARKVLEPIAERASVLFCSIGDASKVFGIEGTPQEVTARLMKRFGSRYVVSTDHMNGPYLRGPEGFTAYATTAVPVIDRPGAGDAFIAATIHGYLSGDIASGVQWGQRASEFAITHMGDLTRIRTGELRIPLGTDIDR